MKKFCMIVMITFLSSSPALSNGLEFTVVNDLFHHHSGILTIAPGGQCTRDVSPSLVITKCDIPGSDVIISDGSLTQTIALSKSSIIETISRGDTIEEIFYSGEMTIADQPVAAAIRLVKRNGVVFAPGSLTLNSSQTFTLVFAE